MPPYVYVPGQNTRHPEDLFAAVKGDIDAGAAIEDLHKSEAFRTGIAYFHAGFFWECHEVLEAVWLHTRSPSAEREMVQAVIQLANARLKLLMHRPRATIRLCDMVMGHLERCPKDRPILGLKVQDVAEWVRQTRLNT